MMTVSVDGAGGGWPSAGCQRQWAGDREVRWEGLQSFIRGFESRPALHLSTRRCYHVSARSLRCRHPRPFRATSPAGTSLTGASGVWLRPSAARLGLAQPGLYSRPAQSTGAGNGQTLFDILPNHAPNP